MEAGKAMACECPEVEDTGSLWMRLVKPGAGKRGEVWGRRAVGILPCPFPAELEWQPSETGSELEDPVGPPQRLPLQMQLLRSTWMAWGDGKGTPNHGTRAHSRAKASCPRPASLFPVPAGDFRQRTAPL